MTAAFDAAADVVVGDEVPERTRLPGNEDLYVLVNANAFRVTRVATNHALIVRSARRAVFGVRFHLDRAPVVNLLHSFAAGKHEGARNHACGED